MPFVASEELEEELEALEYIFTQEEYILNMDDDTNMKKLEVKIHNQEKTKLIVLIFRFSNGYPETDNALLSTGDLIGVNKKIVQKCLSVAKETIQESKSEPQVFSVVQSVRDYLDSIKKEVSPADPREQKKPLCSKENEKDKKDGKDGNENVRSSERSKAVKDASKDTSLDAKVSKVPMLSEENGQISKSVLSELTKEAAETLLAFEKNVLTKRKKMYWGNFTIGLVGKPSAGKSTFFNAVKTLNTKTAKVGSFPFTTIEPNIGKAAVAFFWPKIIQVVVDDNNVHSKAEAEAELEERRTFYLEVYVKDVAGLVEGAYCGRGHGNKFLDDLCQADVLVHVLDCSGDTDKEGNSVGGGKNSIHDPCLDVEWVYEEIHRWISDNVLRKYVPSAFSLSPSCAVFFLCALFSCFAYSM